MWGIRVLRLREAFLIQMNDFDRLLEFELRRMLDPVVGSKAPPRRRGGTARMSAPFLAVASPPLELAPEAIAVVDPIVATLPAQPAALLS